MQNESWVYQGRQAHGWFGSGTAPRDGSGETPGAPASLAERVTMVAGAAVAETPREQRARFEAQLGRGMLKSLTDAMPAWSRSAGLDPERFHAHFFPHASTLASARIQAVAAAVGWGGDLGPAATALAGAVQAMGDSAPRLLAAAADRATPHRAGARRPRTKAGVDSLPRAGEVEQRPAVVMQFCQVQKSPKPPAPSRRPAPTPPAAARPGPAGAGGG